MSTIQHQYIIYACPVGKLHSQLQDYWQKSRDLYGENAAHKYMPHCTLTGFFTAELVSIPIYLKALDRAYLEAKNNSPLDLNLDLKIIQLTFKENWHGLELHSNSLKKLIANFAEAKTLEIIYSEQLRLKDWLHLSLAYDFNLEHTEKLKELAIATIDLKANVNWELRFYERKSNWTWKSLQSWEL